MFKILTLAPGAVLKYVALLPLNVTVILLSWFLSPFLSTISVLLGRDTLPSLLQNFSTLDDSLDGGQHQQPDKYPSNVSGFKLIWQRTCWICRNPGQGWQAVGYGYKDAGRTILWSDGTSGLNWDLAGCWYGEVVLAANGKKYFSYRKNVSVGKKYFKTWWGWHFEAKNGVDHHYKMQLPKLQ